MPDIYNLLITSLLSLCSILSQNADSLLAKKDLTLQESLTILNTFHDTLSLDMLIKDHYLMEGNSSIQDAEILIFPEIHDDTSLVIKNILLAIMLASEGDQMFFEGRRLSEQIVCYDMVHTKLVDHYYDYKKSKGKTRNQIAS